MAIAAISCSMRPPARRVTADLMGVANIPNMPAGERHGAADVIEQRRGIGPVAFDRGDRFLRSERRLKQFPLIKCPDDCRDHIHELEMLSFHVAWEQMLRIGGKLEKTSIE